MQIEWRPTLRADVDLILPRTQAAQLGQIEQEEMPRTEAFQTLLEAQFRTFVVAGVPAALFGVYVLWAGVGRIVGLISDEALTAPLSLTRCAKWGIIEAFHKLDLRRLECTVEEGHEQAHEWAEALRFTPEGLLRYYGPNGSHHWIYARFREGLK